MKIIIIRKELKFVDKYDPFKNRLYNLKISFYNKGDDGKIMQYTYMYFIIINIVSILYKVVLFNVISYLYSNQVFINYLINYI